MILVCLRNLPSNFRLRTFSHSEIRTIFTFKWDVLKSYTSFCEPWATLRGNPSKMAIAVLPYFPWVMLFSWIYWSSSSSNVDSDTEAHSLMIQHHFISYFIRDSPFPWWVPPFLFSSFQLSSKVWSFIDESV